MESRALAFDIPQELIAQHPAASREEARMMVLHRSSGNIEHRKFFEFPDYLNAEKDILVLNASRVIRAKLPGKREKGTGKVEILLVRRLGKNLWKVLLKPSRRVKEGEKIFFEQNLTGRIVRKYPHGEAEMEFPGAGDLTGRIEQVGLTPLPPYIKRRDRTFEDVDRERYQTVYADRDGSVAAPTAGMHFTRKILENIRKRDIASAMVTMHVGPGTFRPIRTERVEDHRLESEYYQVSGDTCLKLSEAFRKNKHVLAVGTTTTRTLETIGKDGFMRGDAVEGWTDLFIYPPFRFTVVNHMLTNFHLPGSSLLALVAAFAGLEPIRNAYRLAVEKKYRFYSYGDCMLIL